MSSIRILSDRVANQIAAGEVIERPVAVVKELVENSIDAGATRIEVEFRDGGKSYMRIEDNGKGMSPDEALIALERHATSKIREASDLKEIDSFGFRGEALPSIASVSKFTMRTRAEGWPHGTEIVINGGKLVEKKDCGMPVGTAIEIAHLFNSVPARRKFLKTDPTETAHITYTTRLFAVAHPSIAFRLLENRRTLFQSPACERLKDRIAEIWGRQLADDLIPVQAADASKGYKLSGLTAKAGVGRSTRRELVTLVNRRPVDSRTLGFAVLDAYHGRIQKGRYPPAFLFFDIRPQEIDVNVHPSKRKVCFRDEGSVRRFVLEAIGRVLDEAKKTVVSKAKARLEPAIEKTPTLSFRSPQEPIPVPSITSPAPPQNDTRKVSVSTEGSPEKPAPETPAKETNGWCLIALLKNRYALFETPQGLVMLHLRHAEQRVRFERVRKLFKSESAASQSLLMPHLIELEPLAADALKRHLDLLNSNGFRLEEFGRHLYRIETVPTWLEAGQVENFLRDLIDLFRQRESGRQTETMIWDAVAKLSIKDGYRKPYPLGEKVVEKLARSLLACENPHTSPDGKPTFHEISWSEWERRLGTNG